MTFVNIVIFFLISFCGLYITYYISNKFDLFDYPNKKKIHLIKTANIAGVIRDTYAIIPFGNFQLMPNDKTIVFSLTESIKEIEKFFQ